MQGGRWSSRASWWCGPCGGSGDQTSKARPPEWEQGAAFSCACSRRSGKPPASTGFYGGAAATYSRSPFPGNTSSSSRGRAPPDAQPLLWSTVFDRIHVRLIVVCNDGPWLSYKGLTWGWLAICPRRVFGDNRPGPTRSTRRVPRRDPVPAATIAVVPRTRAAAATKADDRRRDHHRQRPQRMVGLAALSAARTQPSRMGHPGRRFGDGHPVFIGGTPGGYQGWQMEQCWRWATQVGGPECARDAGIPERGTQVCRQFQQGAHRLQQPAPWPSCFGPGAPSECLSSRRGRIMEVHNSHHGCSCTKASRQEASEKSSRHGDYCGLPPKRKVRPSTSTCCSIPHDAGRERRQQWIGFLRKETVSARADSPLMS